MTIFGIDVSRHQAGIDLRKVEESAGIDFVMAKLTEGVGWQDPQFGEYLSQAQETNLLFAAYHFLRGDSPPGDQARNVRNALGGLNVPVILDIERTNGIPQPKMSDVRVFRDVALNIGVQVASLLYFPQWYWDEIGRPDTGGWSLWQSNYGQNDGIYPGDGSARWQTMGRQASILQFTSQGRVPGYALPIDRNAYRGTREELAATGWFYDMKEQEVATKAEIQKWVAETPVVVDTTTGETQQLQRVLRRLLAAQPAPATNVDEIVQKLVAALPDDNDLTRNDVKEAVTAVFRERFGA
jgi:GH25 family lysozyme M1 (1,4-beta-N-acetylmuramidase)